MQPTDHDPDWRTEAAEITDRDGLLLAQTHLDIARLVLPTKPAGKRHGFRHGVYALLCLNHYASGEDAVSRATGAGMELTFPADAERIREIAESSLVFYVGYSSDVVSRIHQHKSGRGSLLTTVFPPKQLVDVEWFGTEEHARLHEKEAASELQELNECAYVGGGR